MGLLGFARVLNFFLKRYYDQTILILIGLMIGAMKKVWPWKEVLEEKVIRGKVHVVAEQNILPSQLDASVMFAIAVMVVGFFFVVTLEKWSEKSSTH